MPISRQRRRGASGGIGLAALVAAALPAAALPAAAATAPAAAATVPAAARAPAQELAAAVAAIRHEPGVSETRRVVNNAARAVYRFEIGKLSGEMHLSVTEKNQRGTLDIEKVRKDAYIKGNAFGLSFLGLTVNAAAARAGAWLVASATGGFGKAVTGGLTVAATAAQFVVPPSVSFTATPATTRRGLRVLGMTASTSTSSLTIYLRATGPPLPVEVTEDVSGTTEVVVYTWHKVPAVVAPTGAVRFRSSWLSAG